MEDIKYWIWFSKLENISPKILNKLLDKYKTPQNLWQKYEEELITDGIKEKHIKEILNKNYKQNLDKYVEYMVKNNIGIIKITDEDYPYKLKSIFDPPVVLYYKGNKKILNEQSVAIVGCRKCTLYGKNVAIKFACELAKKNINVISGLAEGIDSYSHIGSLRANGNTIAVVGCGLDRVYPKQNKALFEEIIKNNGVIISEYVIGTKPLAQNFPKRNRIISGLSDVVIVVEAKQKSGTLITVDFALEQGKEIYVVPGNINSINSVGTNELIKQGAQIITDINDILK